MSTDRYVSPHPLPEGYERELLVILQEECAEVIQHVSKALRFGLADAEPGQPITNATRIGQELGHVECMVQLLRAAGAIHSSYIEYGRLEKLARLARFMQTQPPASVE